MIGKMQLRRLYEDRKKAGKPHAFVADLREQMGLPRNRFDYHRDAKGRPYLKDPAGGQRLRPEEVSLRGLAEATCGENWVARLDPQRQSAMALLESGPGPGVDPTAFIDISAFNSAVSGLVEIKLLESYQQPEFIGDKIAQTVPTRMNGQKVIGISDMGDVGRKRMPGMPHQPADVGERYVQTPETSETAVKVEVLQESVFYDLTGDVLQKTGAVGRWLGYRDENDALDSFIGVTTTYSYKGTTFSTYQNAVGVGGGNYKNLFVNPLNDYTSLDAALLNFVPLTDPENPAVPITLTPKVIVATPFLASKLDILKRSTQVALVDNTVSAATIRSFADLPPRISSAFGEPLISTLLYYRLTASTTDPAHPGLGYATGIGGKAAGTWFVGDPAQGHWKMENWPLRVRQASATEYQMFDRGLVAAYFADYRNVYTWTDPRYCQQNTPT